MSEAIPPFPQYVFMAWCSVKAWGKLYFTLLYDGNKNWKLWGFTSCCL